MRILPMTIPGQTAVPTTGEQYCQVGNISLCYEAIGDPNAQDTVVLIMGLGLQMVWWRDDFCTELTGRGIRVVRFDNRDVGHSTRVPGPGVTALGFLRRRAVPTYSLSDMADDTAGLIAQVAPRGAHVVGVSLGSLIAQEVAIRHPSRTRSLVSIMGRPGDGRTGAVAKRMLIEFVRPAGRHSERARPTGRPRQAGHARLGDSRRPGPDHPALRRTSDRRGDPRGGTSRDRRDGP